MKADPVTEAAILKRMNGILNAFAQRNLEEMLSMFHPAPDVTLIGTEAGERYVGLEKIRSYYKQSFEQVDRDISNISIELDDPAISESGNVAWVATGLIIKFEMAGNKVNIYSRNTTIFLKQNEDWLVTHIHNSTPLG